MVSEEQPRPQTLERVVRSFHKRLATIVVISCREERVIVTVMLKGLKTQMAVCHKEVWS